MERIRVVIVDDQPIHLMVLSSYFDLNIYEVFSFESAEEALVFAKSNQTDVYVVDYFMPVYNGVEFIEKIKTMNPRIKCILYTSEQIEQNNNIDFIMHKPVVKHSLLSIIEQIINNQ